MENRGLRFNKATAKPFAFVLSAALLVAPAVFAQYTPPKQQPAPQPAPTGQPASKQGPQGQPAAPETPPVNKAEEDAAKAFFDLKAQDNAQTIQLGEDFVQKFSDSRYRDSVYARLMHAYLNSGKEDKVLSTGEKALAINADNVDVLALMSWYLGHRYNPNALDAEQRMQTIERDGKRALELIATLQKPAGVTDESFARAKAEKEAMSHTGLALAYYHQNRVKEMITEFEQSTKLDPSPDPLDFFLLADGDLRLKRYTEAAAAYDRCSQASWVWQDRCKSKLAQVKTVLAAQPAPAPAPAAAPPAAPAASAPANPAPAADPAKPKPPRS